MSLLKKTSQIILCFFIFFTTSFAANLHAHSKLIDYSFIGQFTSEQAKQAMQKVPPLSTLPMNFSLNTYKIHYQTTAPDGTKAIASGLVAMPISPEKSVGIVSYHHGTRILRTDVPSKNDERNSIYLATFGNSGGYMVVMPDYLGLGDSSVKLHPYVDANTLANTSIDMITAAKELAASLNYAVNDQLFLTGYSEGGFTTTVTYEEILKHHPELPVTAVSPGSAPYDYNVTMKFVATEPGPRSSVYLAYFFYSLQTYYHYWSGMDEIFKKPYDTLIPILYDGAHTNQQILDAIPKDPRALLNDVFLNNLLQGTDPHTREMQANFNHFDFTPTSPMLMVGTKGDHDVPYHGAEIAYDVFKTKTDKVYMKSVSDVLDHITAFPVITREQLAFFKQYDH